MALPLEDREAAEAANAAMAVNAPVAPVTPAPAPGGYASRVAGAMGIAPDAPVRRDPVPEAAPDPSVPVAPVAAAPANTPAKPAAKPVDDDAFVDYMHQMSVNGALGNLPAVKYDSSNASAGYKAALIAGNPKFYAAWVANQGRSPSTPVQAAAPDATVANVTTNSPTAIAAKAAETGEIAPLTDPGTPATGGVDDGQTLPSYMTAGRELEASMTPEERAAAAATKMPQLNAEGTAPAGETKASFGDWLKDKFGKKADKMDFWDAIEIWGAALAGNEPRMYNAKLQKLKDEKDRAQRATELTEERAFQEKLQTMLADRETQKLLAMQGFEANQANAGWNWQAGQAANAQAFTANQNALDRAIRERELAQQRALLEAQIKANAFNYGGLRPPADRANIYAAQ